MTAINRRKALTVVASVPAVAALAAVPAIAAVGEDAELTRLWEEWKAQHLRCRDLYNVHQALEGEALRAGGPVWRLAKLDCVERGKYSALFYSSRPGDNQVKG